MVGLSIEKVCFAYASGPVLNDIDLKVGPGEMVGLLGPNGSGKTTLLKVVAGILRPGQGEIKLNGFKLIEMGRKAIARHIAVVPQSFSVPYAFTVEEVVALGRIPFLKLLSEESSQDRDAVQEAMRLVGIVELRRRRFDELSGGEKQKVVLAMTLAQRPELLLLDEPTVHLDISHQVQILELVKKLNDTKGLTVLAVLHDLNLASLYFNRLLLLKGGRILTDGSPATVLTEENIAGIFDMPVRVEPHPVTGTPNITIIPGNKN